MPQFVKEQYPSLEEHDWPEWFVTLRFSRNPIGKTVLTKRVARGAAMSTVARYPAHESADYLLGTMIDVRPALVVACVNPTSSVANTVSRSCTSASI